MIEQTAPNFLLEYAIEQVIDDSAPCRLYRARRLRDGQRLLLKLVPRQAQREAQRLRREFALSRQCELEGVLRALDWSEDDEVCALILEDPGGEPLDRLLDDGPLALASALGVAQQLAQTLAGLHQREIVHRDLRRGRVSARAKLAQLYRRHSRLAAARLGLKPGTLWSRMKKLGIERP